MYKVCFLLVLFVFNLSGMDGGEFYRRDNGWVYMGREMDRVIGVLEKVKLEVSAASTRTQVEIAFRDAFVNEYIEQDRKECEDISFAWTQSCLKRIDRKKGPIPGIDTDIGWIKKIKSEGGNVGIYLNYRPSDYARFNFLWNWKREEKQVSHIGGKAENKTWEVDRYGAEELKKGCYVQ